MAQYIDKDALVAEIERLKTIYKDDENIRHVAKYNILVDFLYFINTLEVKEVDLEKEIKEQTDKYYSQCEKKLQEMCDDNDISFLTLDNFARHFFELGLKAQKGE